MSVDKWLRRLGHWRDYLTEYRWSLSPEVSTHAPPSFELDPGELAKLTIRWPVEYEWPVAANYLDDLRRGISTLARVEPAQIPQHRNVVVIEAVYDGRTSEITIDYSDITQRVEWDRVEKSALYFKMQYLAGGYGGEAEKIVPGGYVNGHSEVYKYAQHVRPLTGQPAHYEVYGRFGLQFAKEIRTRAVQMLNEQRSFQYEGSLRLVRYSRFLREVAQAKICIDLPSNSPFCFRLIDYFAVGACVIGPRHEAVMHVPLQDREHIVYTRPDLSDLIPLCEYYLHHDEERKRIQQSSRDYFEKYLHREQLGRYYLQQILRRVA